MFQLKMSSTKSHRQVPTPLRKILNLDEKLTDKFCLFMNKFLPFRQLRVHHQLFEWSCHGLIWLAGWIAFIYLISSQKLYEMQINFFIGLILDIVLIAIIKAYVRRRRPTGNVPDMKLTFSVDASYSFPSGHASRVTFIAYFFIFLFPLPFFCFPPLLAWMTSLCISRILMKRHHILDVLAGILLGIFEGLLIGLIWLNSETCSSIMSSFLDGTTETSDSST